MTLEQTDEADLQLIQDVQWLWELEMLMVLGSSAVTKFLNLHFSVESSLTYSLPI